MTAAKKRVALRELFAESFKVGCLGFGGPAGQIALMHRLYVEEKAWIDEPRYLHALNFCMLLPGPEAQQLAIYVGWLVRGVIGGVIAGVLFVLPGMLVVGLMAWAYAVYADVPMVSAIFYGVKIAVVAIVGQAMVKIGRRALKSNIDFAISVVTLFALFLLGAPFPLVILTAGAIGFFVKPKADRSPPEPVLGSDAPSAVESFKAAGAALVLWLAPLALVWATFGGAHTLTQVGVLFSQLAVVTFGGAYAVLAYLQQQAVDYHQWLSAAEMIDGLGLAETTPGPLVLVNQYVGFIAGWNTQGLGLAIACALMASWCTFVPSFLWIFAIAPFGEQLRQNERIFGALRAITAAVLGVVANLALWFSLHVFFARVNSVDTLWGRPMLTPEFATVDPFAVFIALLAGIALIRLNVNILVVIAGCGLLGLARMIII